MMIKKMLGSPTLVRQKIASITQLLRLPSVCELCRQYHNQPVAICELCQGLFQRIGPCCRYCALPLPDEDYLVCGYCCKKQPFIDKTMTAYLFEEPLRTLLHRFKYKDALYLQSFLVSLMLKALPPSGLQTDCLVPVPLHPRRMRERGYNQAAELCKRLAKQFKVPYELNLCKKRIHTPSQAGLSGQQRRENLRHVFEIKSSGYQHITLVDDLLTTGSTANELARAFKVEGVKQVELWCCARVSLENIAVSHLKQVEPKGEQKCQTDVIRL
jgi:ComF family protein